MMPVLLLSAAAGISYGLFVRPRPESAWRTAAKMVPVTLLALAALQQRADPALVAALALGALGDGFLAQRGKRCFLLGLASFLAAHLAYCALFAAQQSEAWTGGPVFLGGTIAVLALVAGAYRALSVHLDEFRFPVAAYCAVIGAMLVLALGRGPDITLLAGVALFAASDLVLGFETFAVDQASPARRWTGPFIWFAYFAGQWLIAYSLLA